MKHAYVSLVIPVSVIEDFRFIRKIDVALAQQARAHEIVVVTPYRQSLEVQDLVGLQGPVSIIATHTQSTEVPQNK